MFVNKLWIMPHFNVFTSQQLEENLATRVGETKLGETILLPNSKNIEASLVESNARFVLLGLPEDIGVRANLGVGGASTGWSPFLKSFLNIQHTTRLPGTAIMLLGDFDFTDLLQKSSNNTTEYLRQLTAEIDAHVAPVIEQIVRTNKIPIVIGGGHNNAYPIIKGCSRAFEKGVNAINLDAHSDFRIVEGRHSGNGFRYAYDQHFLEKYAVLGLHEAYNSIGIVEELQQNNDTLPIFWEDIFLRSKYSWLQAVEEAIRFVHKQPFGVELDLDAVEQVLSSAATPLGISAQQAAQYLYLCGQRENAVYLHLPEGISLRSDGQESKTTGKLLSYFVQFFIKGVLER